MSVGGVDLDDQMEIERRGHVAVDVAHAGEEFLVAAATLALRQQLTGVPIQGGE